MPDHRQPAHTGGCQCGHVRFAFYAEPVRVGICHCRMCQRATAAPFACLADVPIEHFAWTKGAPKSFQSSSIAERHFCADCGTPLSYHQIGGAHMEILLGAFDEPSTLAPSYAVGIESKLAWVDTLHELPAKTFAQYAGPQTEASIISRQAPPKA